MSLSRTNIFFSSLCFSAAFLFGIESKAEASWFSSSTKPKVAEEPCGKTPLQGRIEVKHIGPKGIGYNQGYTSVEGFLPSLGRMGANWLPFMDVRAHIFNNGHPDINAGLGARYLGSRIWGANVYYDYRKTSHYHYNQVGAGLESLGKIWDFRINGYFPLGEKSRSYRFKFHEFQGNHLILSNKKEFAMTGGNAEVGIHAYHHDRRKKVDIYTALGPYYFNGQGRTAWGGEGRIVLTASDYVRMQLSGSYDTVFKGIVQGEVGFFFQWGGKKPTKKRSDKCVSPKLIERAMQRVDRQEIIVLDRKRQRSKAINPATDEPYTFWFVNNTSHSQGTFESPYNTLLAAENASNPNDIIYVFVGDGTDTGMNSGITLQRGQQLLGAGINQKIITTHGNITIPAQDRGLPTISNANDPTFLGVQLVNGNNVLSGLNLQDKQGAPIGLLFSSAVTIENGSNYLIQNNVFETLNVGSCVSIYGPAGNTSIINNTFLANGGFNATDGIFFYDAVSPVTGSFYIANNLFKGVDNNSGFNDSVATFGPGTPLGLASKVSLKIVSNTFVSQTNTALEATAIDFTAENATLLISGNYIDISDFSHPQSGIYLEQDSPDGLLSASLDNNVSYSMPPTPGYQFVNNSGNPSAMQIFFSPSNVGTREGP